MESSAPRAARRRSGLHLLWPLLTVGAMLVAVIAWWAPGAGADSSVSQTGQVGTHFLFDEPSDPGARCLFVPATGIFSITVDGPYVLGLDRASGPEQTEVSWRAIAVRNGVQVQSSAPVLGTAFEGQSADFASPITLTLLDPTGIYTAQVEIVWFESTASGPPNILGTSLRRVDVYAQNLEDSGPDTIVGSCQAVADPTPEPTATDTPLPTATHTPTATNTPEPTATTPPTATAPATATSTPTQTPAPTATPTLPPGPSGPPRLATSSSRGTVNAKVRVEIAGFPANASTEVTFAGVTIAAVSTDASGTASVTIRVPAKPKGTYEVRAATADTDAVTTYEIAPRIKVSPGSAGPGEQVGISLRGFAKNERVRIRWLIDGRWVELVVIPRTSNTGSANITLPVPDVAPGPAKVRGDGTIARAQTNAFDVTD